MSNKNYDNYEFETKIYSEGYEYIAGTDEVGRGCIAGPVVASAVIMPKGVIIEGVTDSKLLTDKKRRLLKEEIMAKALAVEVTFISEAEIDEINILEASRKAMIESIKRLKIKPDYVLADAMKLPIDIPTMDIIKGDLRSHSIGCASIVAKVIRDDFMINLAKEYPGYDLEKNKGYPTPFHKKAVLEIGVTPIHRKTYEPVRIALEKEKTIHQMRLWPNPFKKIKKEQKQYRIHASGTLGIIARVGNCTVNIEASVNIFVALFFVFVLSQIPVRLHMGNGNSGKTKILNMIAYCRFGKHHITYIANPLDKLLSRLRFAR